MKNVKSLLFLSLMVLSSMVFFTSCDKDDDDDTNNKDTQVEWEVLVYGRPTCGLCNAFKDAADAEGLEYTFYDIDTDSEKNSEMWDKLNDAGMGGGSITLPVVDAYVDGESHMFSNPSVAEVMDVLP
ncbi:MAG: glutaredoxin family protein [Bacteroidota bacterium]